MIKKFDCLYAGAIDLDNIGYAGTPTNDRRYANEQLAAALTRAQAMAKLMDRTGYETLWLAEHHFQREGTECIPNVLMMALHLTGITSRLKIGCGFNIAPMWHPLRLAEDYAVADILSGGRVIFGVGRGYHTREVETFGAPLMDQAANRELFEEQVDIIFKAFHQDEFEHQGKYYTLPAAVPYRGYLLKNLTLVPRPARLPVECWQPIQGGSLRGMEFMAKHGMHGMIGGGSAEGGAMRKVIEDWRAANARVGRQLELGERLGIGYYLYIAKDKETGMKEAAAFYEETTKTFAELRVSRTLTDEQIVAMRDPKVAPTAKLPHIEDAVKSGAFLTGSAEEIVDQLKALERRYPSLDRVAINLSVGVPRAVALDQIERFAAEVMPSFN